MVGRDDAHHFDVFAIEQLAIVLVDVGLPLPMLVFLASSACRAIDVADGHDVGEAGMLPWRRRMPWPPRPMQPNFGRSLAAALANAGWLQAT